MRARSTRCKVASRSVALCRRKSMLPKSMLLKSMLPESMLPKSTLPKSPLSRRHGKSWAVRLVFFTVSGAIALALLSHGVTPALAQNQNAQGRAKPPARQGTWLAENISWRTWPCAASATHRATATEILTGLAGCRARPSPGSGEARLGLASQCAADRRHSPQPATPT